MGKWGGEVSVLRLSVCHSRSPLAYLRVTVMLCFVSDIAIKFNDIIVKLISRYSRT